MANANAEVVDFEPEDDDLMDDNIDASPCATHLPKLKSAITSGASSFSSALKKTKGCGFREEAPSIIATEKWAHGGSVHQAQLTQEFFRENTLRLLIFCLPKLNLEARKDVTQVVGNLQR
ncbi:hypothetical protein K2173_020265 [Erythroxylum novogranatense]|uniref:Uncharacterized protein n=1 Tax=Erythroxylum novogranatense TaxID=1862640 RepID=A0AAV8U8P9_9ROSI|nr:hypothetical protein K2173_020265 [Erythroxylum novogranatense]